MGKGWGTLIEHIESWGEFRSVPSNKGLGINPKKRLYQAA